MKLKSVFILLILLIVSCSAFKKDKDSVKINSYFYIPDNTLLELSFIIRIIPDNGWIFEIKKDKTYNYKHVSGWAEELIIDKGTYHIHNNKIILKSNFGKANDEIINFYITQIDSNNISHSNCITDKSNKYIISKIKKQILTKSY